jgi:hypothetical protein
MPPGIVLSSLQGETFPPLSNAFGPRIHLQRPGAWLGIRSPAFKSSNKMKGAILGALALTPAPRLRHFFSGRDVFGGRFTVHQDGKSTFAAGEAHTPPLYSDIVLSGADARWLAALAAKVISSETNDQRQMRALEYFYRAWPLDLSERFPVLCMSLDAIFGEAIHGSAPDVYDCSGYAKYYYQFGDDPIRDLELVVAQCLRLKVFDGVFAEHPDPLADEIAARRPPRKGILDV